MKPSLKPGALVSTDESGLIHLCDNEDWNRRVGSNSTGHLMRGELGLVLASRRIPNGDRYKSTHYVFVLCCSGTGWVYSDWLKMM